MVIKLFNVWYFFWIFVSLGVFFGLYFLLRKKSDKVKKYVLFGVLVFALVLHFLKAFIPPYSTDIERWYRDSWFINICGANIFLFPFIFMSKSKGAKDYMVFLGIISGIISVLYPIEPMIKANPIRDIWDIIRFYLHHTIIWAVPLLTVVLKLHSVSYKRVLSTPTGLLIVMLFIMLNQIFQAELGFIPLQDGDITTIDFKNSSYIWGPDDAISRVIAALCPDVFKTVPVGEFAGQEKYWPWFWLIVPAYIVITPMAFLLSLIWDGKNFKADVIKLKNTIVNKINGLKLKKASASAKEEQADCQSVEPVDGEPDEYDHNN